MVNPQHDLISAAKTVRVAQCSCHPLLTLLIAWVICAAFAATGAAQTGSDKPLHRKLDSALNQLIATAPLATTDESRTTGAVRPTLEQLGFVEYGLGRVGVTVRFSGSGEEIRKFVLDHGGHVAYTFEGAIEAYLAPAFLPDLSASADVGRIDSIRKPEPQVVSQGVQVHNATPWQAAGYLGQGVKVGIIDTGYQGYLALPHADQPPLGAVRCYTGGGFASSQFLDCENGSVHGTAVMEAVHDIAPGAIFYLADYNTNGDLHAAVQWMVQQGVRVINMSLAFDWDGPGDGTSPYADSPLKAVDAAVVGGAVVLISSGNYADKAWFGTFQDPDADGYLEFDGNTDLSCLTALAGEYISVELRWQDSWGGATRDLDLRLRRYSTMTSVASSIGYQDGGASDVPHEELTYTASAAGVYCVEVRRHSGTVPGWVQFRVSSKQTVDVANASGSTTNPAETANAGALAVGAASWQTPSTIGVFSGRGPTPNGRIKPDIVGVDNADSFTYGPNGFSGTSQAAPHVAGLAAIVVQGYPNDSPADIAGRLKGWALPRGGNIPNNTWGYGLAYLPTVYNLTVSRAGPGQGTVTSVDNLVNCGVACVQTYFGSAATTLTAHASVGSTFTGWSGGGCSGTGTCTVTMNAATTVAATFGAAPSSYTLNVAKAGTGSGTVSSIVAGISCGASCSASFVDGTGVTLAASPAVGSTFTGWSGGGCSGTGWCTVTLSSATTVTAAFTLNTYSLTVSRDGTGSGTVTSTSPVGAINCGPTCTASLVYGTLVTLTATPAADSVFTGWSVGCTGSSSCSVALDQARSVQATFTLKPTALTYYLAEGATGAFFDLDIIIANPNVVDAPVSMTFLDSAGKTYPLNFTLPGKRSRTVAVETEVPALASADVSTIVTSSSGLPLIVERSLFWDATYYGGHTGNAVDGPQKTWYFGEGYQSQPGIFDTFILLANASAAPATVTLSFLRQGAAPVSVSRGIGPMSRANFWAAELPADLVGQSFSTSVTSSIPIIAERAMYFGSPLFSGGHESAGVSAPATRWFHPEGRTGPFFDTYILIGNPGSTPANVTVRFLRANDTPITTTLTVGAQSRETIYVDGVPGLPDTDVSTEVTSDVPVISERAMYWPGEYAQWYEAHNSFGVTSTGVAWGLAEGRFGFPQKFETYILLTNPTNTSTRVRVTFLRQGNRAPIVSEQVLGANARANVDMTALLTAPDYDPAGERFGAIVESLDNVGIAVERAMYFTTSTTQFWNGGTNATAVKLR